MNWKKAKALEKLNIKQVPFEKHEAQLRLEIPDGYVHGVSTDREFAVNPTTPYKAAAGFHEMGHIVLGHTAIHEKTVKDTYLEEMEACAVSILCMKKLDMGNWQQEAQREHYWFHRDTWRMAEGELPADFKAKVNKAANEILEAGAVEEEFVEAA